MLAAVEQAVWSELVVVGSVECMNDGTIISAHNVALFLFVFKAEFLDTEVCIVARDMR